MNIVRTVNTLFDVVPTLHHRYEAKLVYSYCQGKSILDIGCWTGQFLSLIKNSRLVTGLDIDADAINFARKHRHGNYVVGSALSLPFKNNQFDVVTMWDVIEHLPEGCEERAVAEAQRVLKKGGIFALGTVTRHPVSILLDPAFFLLHHRHYSKDYLRKLIINYRLKVIAICYSGGFWTLLSHNLSLFQKHILKTPAPRIFFQNRLEKEYGDKGFDHIYLLAKK